MVSITPSFLGLIALAISASATSMNFYASTDCSGDGVPIEDPDHSGRCSQLDPNRAHSFKTDAVDAGCTVTVYSDSDCSAGAVAGLGVCMTTQDGQGGLQAYSIDC